MSRRTRIELLAGYQATATLSGSNGVPGGVYQVWSSTNLLSPSGQWQVLVTNLYDTNGSFVFTGSAASNAPQSFYRLKVQ